MLIKDVLTFPVRNLQLTLILSLFMLPMVTAVRGYKKGRVKKKKTNKKYWPK